MTAPDAQVRIIMREREKGRTQEQAAASANLRSRKTVAKGGAQTESPRGCSDWGPKAAYRYT